LIKIVVFLDFFLKGTITHTNASRNIKKKPKQGKTCVLLDLLKVV